MSKRGLILLIVLIILVVACVFSPMIARYLLIMLNQRYSPTPIMFYNI